MALHSAKAVQKQMLFFSEIDDRLVAINLKESPLKWLASRSDSNGQAYLELEEIAAGERFRADFERAGLSPRLGVNFDNPSIGSGYRENFSDMQIAAKERLAMAREALGPSLSSLMVDFLGLLVGLEDCEKSRHWPQRSGKVVVKLALSQLARHYGLLAGVRGSAKPRRHP